MAIVTTRQGFKDYCLRRLGAPTIDINVDNEQVEDRIDDALIKFRDYHYDGTEKVLFPYQVTAEDIENQYVDLPENFINVTQILNPGAGLNTASLFNFRYQIHLNDLFDFSSASFTGYVMAKRHIETIEEIFSGSKPIRFNRHQDRLHIDMDWVMNIEPGQFLLIDGYVTVDPEEFPDVWEDPWLKAYATELIKKQWGSNLSKFSGIPLPGGITLNGEKIYQEAADEIRRMEDELISAYSLPVADFIG